MTDLTNLADHFTSVRKFCERQLGRPLTQEELDDLAKEVKKQGRQTRSRVQ